MKENSMMALSTTKWLGKVPTYIRVSVLVIPISCQTVWGACDASSHDLRHESALDAGGSCGALCREAKCYIGGAAGHPSKEFNHLQFDVDFCSTQCNPKQFYEVFDICCFMLFRIGRPHLCGFGHRVWWWWNEFHETIRFRTCYVPNSPDPTWR